MTSNKKSFGTAPVFFTAISTILGAILFLRFGYAVGTLGLFGVALIIMIGHMVTLPTALALSEIATNEKVEGGGEYFIISRSFGLNIGATIGIALYLSQAISVAFYIIAFTEAFEPLFNYLKDQHQVNLPRQVISIPSLLILAYLMLKKGAGMGTKLLYFVVGILFISLTLFFVGKTDYMMHSDKTIMSGMFRNMDQFFIVFAIVFPAFTGMTAGVGLSGDLKNPGRSIPLGTILGTVMGMIVYLFIIWKLKISASPEDLISDQLIMSKIALYGPIVIPLGLAASTLSSAIGSIMVAPRTLQALGTDQSLPSKRINHFISRGRGVSSEPVNGTLVTSIIALVFVAMGSVDAVASIITMFFMVTYGTICLISFLHHFGADPSYRPTFRSRWYFSLAGFIVSVLLMFQISVLYSIMALSVIIILYLVIDRTHRDRGGIERIFQSAIFQVSRNLQVYLQKSKKIGNEGKWRPAIVCVSEDSFIRDDAFKLLDWISSRYGFGTYIHLIEGYYSKTTKAEAADLLKKLVLKSEKENSHVYIDTIISPSYTSAIAQIIQLPGISGMENNMILFEYIKEEPANLERIVENYALIRAGDYDICVLGSSKRKINYKGGIHVWINTYDEENMNLMILLSYIIRDHPDWRRSHIKIFDICKEEDYDDLKEKLIELVKTGRLPIAPKNIEVIKKPEDRNVRDIINERSGEAGLTILGFRGEHLKHDKSKLFVGYNNVGNILFVNARDSKIIS
jgi:amino acid transporter